MKLKKPLSWLGLALVLTMLLLAIPTASAFAATLVFTPTVAAVGQQVTLTGSGYGANSQIGVYFSNQNVVQFKVIGTDVTIYSYVGQFAADANGNISGTYTIPATFSQGGAAVTSGTYYLYAVQLDSANPNTILTKGTLTVQPNASLNAPSPATGAPGTTITLTGTNFLPSHALTFTFEGAAVTPLTGGTSDTNGAVSATISVPYLSAGAHSITVSDGTAPQSTTFTITPYIAAAPQSGPVGTEVTIAGNGFGAVKSVTIYFNNQQVTTTLTSSTGTIDNTKFTIPDLNLPAGTYDIKVADSSSNLGTAPFQLTVPTQPPPTTTPTPTADIQVTVSGTTVNINGTGFKASSQITVSIEGSVVSTATSDANGAFATQFEVPASVTPGDHVISVTDGTSTKQYTFTKAPPAAAPDIQVLAAGTSVVISGTDFAPNSTITISVDGETLGTLTANAAGAFVSQLQMPGDLKHGDHTIAVTDGTNTKDYTYTVESTPPDIPTAVSPAQNATPKKPIVFEWTPVSDPSAPVTYNLQVATDANFSAGSVVINKTGLSSPSYTLTTDEQDLLTGKSTPYYWHVSAEDAASNQSPWTGALPFNVSAPFSFPTWLIVTVAIVGAIVLFGIGYLVGRRTAFYY